MIEAHTQGAIVASRGWIARHICIHCEVLVKLSESEPTWAKVRAIRLPNSECNHYQYLARDAYASLVEFTPDDILEVR